MTTFAKSTFSAASYAAFRPTYPTSLYNTVLAYHRGPKKLCLDLGCGTGIVTRNVSRHFERVIGTDPSTGMIKQAQAQNKQDNVTFREASAESSSFLQNGEVDCIVSGQAAHWFDYEKLWPELKRLLRPGGTVAFWGYKDPALVDFPKATQILDRDTYGPDPETQIGTYWEPGRAHVRNKLRIIQPPAEAFEDVERVEYEPGTQGPKTGEGTLFIDKRMTIAQMKNYWRTSSAFHAWQEAHPEQISREQGGPGDMVDRMVDEMATEYDWFRDEGREVDMEWGSGLVMCRKK